MIIDRATALVLLSLLVGCSSSSGSPKNGAGSTDAGSPGSGGSHCYPNGTCNAALSCLSNLCVNPMSGAGGQSGAAGGLAGTGGTVAGPGGVTGTAGHIGGAGSRAGGTSSDSGPADASSRGDASCTKPKQIDLYVMLSQTGSMNDKVNGGVAKWAAVTQGITTFVNDTTSKGLGIGIQYFGLPPSVACPVACAIDADCGTSGPCDSAATHVCLGCFAGDSCTASDYATPDVGIGTLPTVGSSIVASLANHAPSTADALAPALDGAITYTKSYAQAHWGHAVAVVLVTDGPPSECTTDLSSIAALAAAGLPVVHTFIVGLGSSTSVLDGVAQAGGTGAVMTVDTNQPLPLRIQQALTQIASSAALACAP